MTHSSFSGSIGRYVTVYDTHYFDGQIDEVRLWDISRAKTDIREYMCKKLTGSEDGLIGYWKFDEFYSSETVEDYTTPSENGTTEGTVNKVTSGAAIGDESLNEYLSSWEDVQITLFATTGDFLRVKEIHNDPLGMQVYRVDDAPYSTEGLTEYCGYYYGVFPISGDEPVEYGIAYSYRYTNGVVTPENRESATLYYRNDASEEDWDFLSAVLFLGKHKLRDRWFNDRMEVIFNIENGAGRQSMTINEASTLKLEIYPNPASTSILFNNLNSAKVATITDMCGRTVRTLNLADNSIMNIDVSNLSPGMYSLTLLSGDDTITENFMVTE